VLNTFDIKLLANSTGIATQNRSAGVKYIKLLANSTGIATQNSSAGAKYVMTSGKKTAQA
jgi:hypothetical protein